MLRILLISIVLIDLTTSLFFPTVTPSCGCGCGCGCGCCPQPRCCCGGGGRKKREIGHVSGHAAHVEGVEISNQCNDEEFGEVILKHISLKSVKQSRDAISKELETIYPDNPFTVFCVQNATLSYKANSQRYCMEGLDGRNCYVFEF